MKRAILVAMFFIMAGVAFADNPPMTFSIVKFTSPTINIVGIPGSEMQFHDEVATTVTLNELKTGSGATAIPLTHYYLLEGNASNIAVGVAKSTLVETPLKITNNNFDLSFNTTHFEDVAGDLTLKDDAVTSPKIALGAVTTSEILDETILNEDIAAGANIAASKLATIPVTKGGTNKTAWTIHAIPVLAGATDFGEIPIGDPEQILTVLDDASGYEWTDKGEGVYAQTVTVAKSGGDYDTITSAIVSITDSASTKPYTVLIYPGVYDENMLVLPDYVSLYGISRSGSRIVSSKAAATPPDDGYILKVGEGCTVANIYIENTYDEYASVAVWMFGPDARIVNCTIASNSFDTFYAKNNNGAFIGTVENCYVLNKNTTGNDTFAVIHGSIEVYDTVVQNIADNLMLWCGYDSGAVATNAKFFNCTFICGSGFSGGAMQVKDAADTVTNVWFTNCSFQKNDGSLLRVVVDGAFGTHSTFYLNGCRYADLGEPAATYVIREPDYYGDIGTFDSLNVGTATGAGTGEIIASGDITTTQGLNVGTATGAGTGVGKFSGTVDALSFTIGANVLTTTEWAHLDGQDQAVDTSSSPSFAGMSIGTAETKAPLQVGATGLASVMADTAAVFDSGGSISRISIIANDGGQSICQYGDDSDEDIGAINYAHNTNTFTFRGNGGPRMTLNGTADLGTIRSVDIADYAGGKPAAAVAYRGQIVLEEGGEGVADVLSACLKGADNTYEWMEIVAGAPL